MCIFGKGGVKGSKCASETVGKEDLTPEEKEILQRLGAKQQRYQQNAQNQQDTKEKVDPTKSVKNSVTVSNDDDVVVTDIYAANMSLLKY
jgi:thiamine pyrophosphate-dependent acetolactate synthase large subunit-like protein